MNTHARKLEKKTSQAVANVVTQKKETSSSFQLKDNRPQTIAQLKGINFDAGIGSGWHVHKGHVKYASNNSTRVNFKNRTSREIGFALENAIKANGLSATKTGSDFKACMTYIREHYK
ncbi:hypothetical protein KAOT1_00930 [Kordia algicida OT-1]|uniref:Uncharacterized protein n=2 Tax=Kordia TaxID=221065 RepID=A9EDQ8_9FLAO|nr:hypothetical protein KAOT1_00930 [Kordia algicida OT-1]